MILASVWSLGLYSASDGKMWKQIPFHAEHHEVKLNQNIIPVSKLFQSS